MDSKPRLFRSPACLRLNCGWRSADFEVRLPATPYELSAVGIAPDVTRRTEFGSSVVR